MLIHFLLECSPAAFSSPALHTLTHNVSASHDHVNSTRTCSVENLVIVNYTSLQECSPSTSPLVAVAKFAVQDQVRILRMVHGLC